VTENKTKSGKVEDTRYIVKSESHTRQCSLDTVELFSQSRSQVSGLPLRRQCLAGSAVSTLGIEAREK
jgi:hypothetical protein